MLALGRVGEGMDYLGPNKGDRISMGGQEQDLICKEYMKSFLGMKLYYEL